MHQLFLWVIIYDESFKQLVTVLPCPCPGTGTCTQGLLTSLLEIFFSVIPERGSGSRTWLLPLGQHGRTGNTFPLGSGRLTRGGAMGIPAPYLPQTTGSHLCSQQPPLLLSIGTMMKINNRDVLSSFGYLIYELKAPPLQLPLWRLLS